MKKKYEPLVSSLDAIINALYDTISGDANTPIDWELFQFLFHPEAKLIPAGRNHEGNISCKYLTPSEYITSSGKWLEEHSFHEKEVHRISEKFGSVTHVFSTYESRENPADEQPSMRGINSIQLLNDERRWWIINIYWTNETDFTPLPYKYLK